MKVNITKILSVAGLALSVIGTIASSVASDRKMNEVVEKVVADKLSNI